MSKGEKLARVFVSNLQALYEKKGAAMNLEDIRDLMKTISGDDNNSLYNKIIDIASTINNAKTEISHINAPSKEALSDANLELGTVVKEMEKATNTILDSAETIQNSLKGADAGLSETIGQLVTKIFEACNFQDITGQRINKVVSTLIEVEKSVQSLLSGIPADMRKKSQTAPTREKTQEEKEKELMRGPQLDAPSQEEIDKLFANGSFD